MEPVYWFRGVILHGNHDTNATLEDIAQSPQNYFNVRFHRGRTHVQQNHADIP
jgi:hypothetical protein